VEILIILIAFSIAVAGAFLGAFFWAVKSGQFEDTFTPSVRMLFETPEKNESAQHTQTLNNQQ
jgi:cbb3-type cytochrome oxidase maturation protein